MNDMFNTHPPLSERINLLRKWRGYPHTSVVKKAATTLRPWTSYPSEDALIMGLLDDKVAIISGIGPGMGRDAALACSKEGAKVVLAARTPVKS